MFRDTHALRNHEIAKANRLNEINLTYQREEENKSYESLFDKTSPRGSEGIVGDAVGNNDPVARGHLGVHGHPGSARVQRRGCCGHHAVQPPNRAKR